MIVVDSLSKRYSACGIRLGSPRDPQPRRLRGLRCAWRRGGSPPPASPSSWPLGARELGPDYSAGVTAEYQRRRDVLYDGLTAIPGLFLRKPEGAFYFVARLPVDDAEDFARFLLAEFSHDGHTVMVAPAPGFYATPGLGHDEVRIAYVLKSEDLERAGRVLAAGLAAYRQAKGLKAAAEAAAAPR